MGVTMLEEYTMEEEKQQEGRSPDSLIEAINRIERLEKQLNIAVEALKKYTTYEKAVYVDKFYDDSIIIEKKYFNDDGKTAEQALKRIKELEK